MTVTGIIAEFNPFHNGHKYLLEQAEGLKIVAMSGNFVQRGEPAIVDKWIRAQMALENGADLVVELPFLVAVQSADHFAKGAVEILSCLGIDQLTFGTEAVIDYQAIATVYSEKEEEMEAFLRSLPEDLSYPQKTQKCGKPLLEWSSQEILPIISWAWPMPRLVLGRGLRSRLSNGKVQATIQKKKKWPMLLRLVYAYTRKIRTLSLDSCPIANSFSRLHRYLGRIMTNCSVIKS